MSLVSLVCFHGGLPSAQVIVNVRTLGEVCGPPGLCYLEEDEDEDGSGNKDLGGDISTMEDRSR